MNPHPVDRWARAFVRRESFTSAKHNVLTADGAAYFHANRIAYYDAQEALCFDLCGYGSSPTTRSRLNAILAALGSPLSLYQRRGEVTLANGAAPACGLAVPDHGPFQIHGPLAMMAIHAEHGVKRAA